MNQHFKQWIEVEKKAWDMPDYVVQEIENGLRVESEGEGVQTVLWNTFLYHKIKKHFKENETFFIYTINDEEEKDTETHYLDFSFNSTYIRVFFRREHAKIIYRVILADSFTYENTFHDFRVFSKDTLKYIYQTVQQLFNAMIDYPSYRIKFALRQLSIPTPEKNFCYFDEYCLREKIHKN